MAWYKTGKVDVQNGSTVVTGTTTRFASNVRVGDGFRGPDGEWYEIVNIASETVMGIFPAYEGPSATDSANYMIAPIQGYNKESADRLRAITDSIRDFSNEIETATEAARSASVSAIAAKASENAAKTSETNVNSMVTVVNNAVTQVTTDAAQVASDKIDVTSLSNQTRQHAEDAANSAAAAGLSETSAATSANNASTSETNTAQKATEAKASADSATASRNAASASETASRNSEQSSAANAATASDAATQTTQDRQATQQARTQAEAARDEAVAAAGTVTGGIVDRGGIDLSSGAYPNKPPTSSIWKVLVGGVVGVVDYGVGDALAYSLALDEFYKIDSTDSVTSVNGKSGIVNLTKSDIGLDQVNNTSDADKPISNATSTALSSKVDKVVGKNLSDENFTLVEKNKLGSIVEGATKNATDATLLNRSNHTGTQLSATISDLAATVRAVNLLGITFVSENVLSTDSILAAMGKLQGQSTALSQAIAARALKGANSDITSLSGLTTPLSVAQGGNGGTVALGITNADTTLNNGHYSTPSTGWVGSPISTGSDAKNDGYLTIDNYNNGYAYMTWRSIDPTVTPVHRWKVGTAWGAWKEMGGSGSGMPVGSIMAWSSTPRAGLPAGWIARDGQLLNRSDWPDLWALVSANAVTDAVWLAAPYTSRGGFSQGNGSTTFRMPDTNGKSADGLTISAMVLRGDGKNSGGIYGVHQVDQVQGMRHRQLLHASPTTTRPTQMDPDFPFDGSRLQTQLITGSSWATGYSPGTGGPITDGVNGAPRVGSETRSANETVIWCTVGAGKAVNPGAVDVVQVATTVSNLQSQVQSIQLAQIITKEFVSSQQVITSGGLLTIPHGLGSQPKLIRAILINVTAQDGYTVGDRTETSTNTNNAGASQGVSIISDSTNIRVKYGSNGNVFTGISFVNGNGFTAINANWRLEIRAYA